MHLTLRYVANCTAVEVCDATKFNRYLKAGLQKFSTVSQDMLQGFAAMALTECEKQIEFFLCS